MHLFYNNGNIINFGGGGGGLYSPDGSVPIVTPTFPIGAVIYAGGSSIFSYEGEPIFQDRVRESRYVTAGTTTSTAGWPTQNFGLILYEGQRGFSWNGNGVAPFIGGFLGTGNETITAVGLCTVNKTSGAGVSNVTFTLQVTGSGLFGFNVAGTTGGVTNIYCYLPAYNSQAASLGYSATSLFTSEFLGTTPSPINHMRWSCFGQNVWYNGGGPPLAATVAWGATSGTIAPWPYGTGTFTVCFNGAGTFAISVNAGSPSISGTNAFTVGQLVQINNWPTTTVTGLGNYINYYISSTGLSTSAFQLSTSLANATAGVVITPGGTGTASATIHVTNGYDIRQITITTAGQTAISWTGATTQPTAALIPQNMAANRNTASNTKFASGKWSASGISTEGFPADWWMDWAAAANASPWLGIPIFADATYLADFFTVLKTKLTGFSKPIYIELGNEPWNSGGGAGSYYLINALAFHNGITPINQLAALHHVVAAAARTAGFTTGVNGQVQIMACWQQANMYDYESYVIYYNAQGWNITADIAYLSSAPYWNLNQQAASPFNYSLSMSIAQIQANETLQIQSSTTAPVLITSPATSGGYNWALENLAITAMDAGLNYGTYEGQWQVNAENSSLTNGGATIMDSATTALQRNFYSILYNAGVSLYTHMSQGIGATTGSSLSPGNEMSTIYPLATTTSPIYNAISQGTPTYTRNVVSGAGSIISGINFADNSSTGTYNNPGNFNIRSTGPTNYANYQGPYGAYYTAPKYGYLGYLINCTTAATYNLDITFSGVSGTVISGLRSNGSQLIAESPGVSIWNGAITLASVPTSTATSVNLNASWTNPSGSYMTTFGDGVTQKRATYTNGQVGITWTGALGVTQSNTSASAAVNFGSVPLDYGSNYVLLGVVAVQTALVSQLQFNNIPSTNLPLGLNLNSVAYYSVEMPFLNIFKSSGSNYFFTPWFTSSGGTDDTGEEAYLQVDSNGYATSLVAGNGFGGTQVFTFIHTLMNFGTTLPPGAPYYYPPGPYTFTFSGPGTFSFTFDASIPAQTLPSGLTFLSGSSGPVVSTLAQNTSASITVAITAPSSSGIKFQITALPGTGSYLNNFSLVESARNAAYLAGEMFHPTFKAAVTPFSRYRMMDWASVIDADWLINFTTALSSGATSGTISTVSGSGSHTTWPFPGATSVVPVMFATGQIINVTFSYGSAAATWTTPLSAAIPLPSAPLNLVMAVFAAQSSWSARSLLSNVSWSSSKGVPYEAFIQLCNETGADCWLNIPAASEVITGGAYATSLAQLAHNGTGANIAGSVLTSFNGVSSTNNIYVEWSNEVWNGTYHSYNFTLMMGRYLFPSQSNAYYAAQEYMGTRVAGIGDSWYSVFGAGAFNGRVFVTMATQYAVGNGTGFLEASMNTPDWTSAAYTHHIGAYSYAPYMGVGAFATGEFDATDVTAILASTNPLNTLFGLAYSNVYGGATYSSVPATGYVGNSIATVESFQSAISAQPWVNLPAVAYESGTSAVSYYYGATSPWLTLITSWHRDIRMSYIHYDPGHVFSSNLGYLPGMITAGFQSINYFADISAVQQYGEFCLLESAMQPITPLSSAPPKYQGAINYINN